MKEVFLLKTSKLLLHHNHIKYKSLFRSEITERLKSIYSLKLKVESDTCNETFTLKFNGTKTILEIKADAYTLTNIPVRHQVWSGWPPNIDDQTMIALSGIR